MRKRASFGFKRYKPSDQAPPVGLALPRPPSPLDQRWSQVVPPESGLTFAVVYDPDEGLTSFSGANVLTSSSIATRYADSPSDAADNRSPSQIFSDMPSPTGGTMHARRLRETYRLGVPVSHDAYGGRASSTVNGLDVYNPRYSKSNRHWSVFSKLDKSPNFDARHAFDVNAFGAAAPPVPEVERSEYEPERSEYEPDRSEVDPERSEIVQDEDEDNDTITDEGFFERPQFRHTETNRDLASRFSSTTTSTSNFVEVEEDNHSLYSSWSAISVTDLPIRSYPNCPTPRKLRKRRPQHHLRSQSEVLNRTITSRSTLPTVSNYSSTSFSSRIAGRLNKMKSIASVRDDRWVCVDVEQTIKQTMVA